MSDETLPIARGLRGRCPRCGEGKLFQGFLSLRPRCAHCGLDFNFADAGDGPAVFVILIVTLVPLRPIKGLMIALQFHHKAQEGRLEHRGDG